MEYCKVDCLYRGTARGLPRSMSVRHSVHSSPCTFCEQSPYLNGTLEEVAIHENMRLVFF